jgi:hypothetical protein
MPAQPRARRLRTFRVLKGKTMKFRYAVAGTAFALALAALIMARGLSLF